MSLDPQKVLMHLHELGYHNITPEQLDEFINDLRRLIKYDIMKKRRTPLPQKPSSTADQSEDSSTFPNTTEESRSPSPPIVQHQPVKKHHTNCQSHSGRFSTREPPEMSRSSSDSSIAAGRTVLRECEKYVAQKSQERINVIKDKRIEASKTLEHPKPTKPCDCNWRTIGCKNCDEHWSKEQNSIKATKSKENLAPRPKSSFIRTWKATGQPRPGSANQRCDPVTLYHQYQQIWKQHKLPGENNHKDLRWTIRENMLGQDPQPRPLSQASSMSSMNRRQKRI